MATVVGQQDRHNAPCGDPCIYIYICMPTRTHAHVCTYVPEALVDADGHGAGRHEEGPAGEEAEGGEEHGDVACPEELVEGVAACVGCVVVRVGQGGRLGWRTKRGGRGGDNRASLTPPPATATAKPPPNRPNQEPPPVATTRAPRRTAVYPASPTAAYSCSGWGGCVDAGGGCSASARRTTAKTVLCIV